MKTCPTEQEGHSDGSSIAPANVTKWWCAPMGANAWATCKVRFLPTAAKLTIFNSYFSVSAYESYPDIPIQTYPEVWITYACSYLVNLMFQYWNEIQFIFAVKFWCKTTSFGPDRLLHIPYQAFSCFVSVNCDQSGVSYAFISELRP